MSQEYEGFDVYVSSCLLDMNLVQVKEEGKSMAFDELIYIENNLLKRFESYNKKQKHHEA